VEKSQNLPSADRDPLDEVFYMEHLVG